MTPHNTDLYLVDTSVAVPLVTEGHEHHDAVFDAIASRRLGLAGHAAFETFSVLSRLPPSARRSPGTVWRIITGNFPHSRHLSASGAEDLVERLIGMQLAGGAVYDALIAAAAVEHGLPLVTRDRRALDTYRAIGVDVEVLA